MSIKHSHPWTGESGNREYFCIITFYFNFYLIVYRSPAINRSYKGRTLFLSRALHTSLLKKELENAPKKVKVLSNEFKMSSRSFLAQAGWRKLCTRATCLPRVLWCDSVKHSHFSEIFYCSERFDFRLVTVCVKRSTEINFVGVKCKDLENGNFSGKLSFTFWLWRGFYEFNWWRFTVFNLSTSIARAISDEMRPQILSTTPRATSCKVCAHIYLLHYHSSMQVTIYSSFKKFR